MNISKNRKVALFITLGIIAATVLVGIYKFNYLASLPNYNADGNKIKVDVAPSVMTQDQKDLNTKSSEVKNEIKSEPKRPVEVKIPSDLRDEFRKTDWSFADPNLEQALSGGPGKDGIPSIDQPKFLLVDTFEHPDNVRAIVLKDRDGIRVYPYNILNWHEIVNDNVAGVPVAVTFCPLCGTAIVYDRRVGGKTLTFGVSGFLLESNMIMFDRESESLWQQSTGRALAGKSTETRLELAPFQLLTMGEVKKMYPKALVLSEETGHRRDYARNPYSGYEDNEDYIFSPSKEDARFPSKTTFVVFRYEGKTVGVPYLKLIEGNVFETKVNGANIKLKRTNDLVSISDTKGRELPFYFEMWFSFVTQHGDNAIIFNPS